MTERRCFETKSISEYEAKKRADAEYLKTSGVFTFMKDLAESLPNAGERNPETYEQSVWLTMSDPEKMKGEHAGMAAMARLVWNIRRISKDRYSWNEIRCFTAREDRAGQIIGIEVEAGREVNGKLVGYTELNKLKKTIEDTANGSCSNWGDNPYRYFGAFSRPVALK